MDGFQFYKKVKGNTETADIPILVMTGRGGMKDTFEGLGVDLFLTKPFQPEELIEQVKKILERRLTKAKGKKRALIAGTEEEKLAMMQEELQAKGYEVYQATSGPEALGRALKLLPDLFVVQFEMPAMDADEIIKMLNSHPDAQKISVVVYSLLQTPDEINHSRWGRFLRQGERKETKSQEAPLKIIDKFNKDSFLNKIKDFT
jgi:CheY-like chemotaxis protein